MNAWARDLQIKNVKMIPDGCGTFTSNMGMLVAKPKQGFGIHLCEWLRGPLKDWAEELLSEERLKEEGFFDVNLVQSRWKEHLSKKRNWEHSLWSVLMFQAWLDSN